METKVLIVGAGPVGLVLANELARREVPFRIVDGATEPSERSRALVVHSRTQELLEEAGLRERIAAISLPIRGMRLSRGRHDLATIPFDLGRFPALSLPQQETERVLRAALADRGGRIEWGAELTGISQKAEGVEAIVGGEPIRAEYLVGCDGAHSATRRLTAVPFEGDSLPETLWMADAALDWGFAPDHARQLLDGGGMLSAIPMPGGIWRLVTMKADAAGDPSPGFFEAAVTRFAGRPPKRLEIRWTSTFRVNCRLAASYGRDRVLLAGDAAHIHSPIGGQGMNVGMQDAFNLAEKLACTDGRAPDELRLSYEADRRPVAAAVIKSNARITRLAMSPGAVPRLLRDHLMPLLLRLPPVARRVGLEASGLR